MTEHESPRLSNVPNKTLRLHSLNLKELVRLRFRHAFLLLILQFFPFPEIKKSQTIYARSQGYLECARIEQIIRLT